MHITKLTTLDGFVVIDLPEAPASTGIVRCARKILQDGAVNLARSLTYSYASFGLPVSGASAAVNAEGEARDPAVAGFVVEVGPLAGERHLWLSAGKGVGADEIAALAAGDPRTVPADTDRLLAVGVVAAVRAAMSELGGLTVGVESTGPAAQAIADAFTAAGATASVTLAPELLAGGSPGSDVIVVGSKPGVVDHEVAARLSTRCIVGSGPLPLTARGLAVARRQGAIVLPDFVSTAGPLLAAWPDALPGVDGSDPDAIAAAVAARIDTAIGALAEHPEGHFLAACYAAEEFLGTWADALPFGRPLA